ncbi:lycopene cyclase domain-containing protein [bacterium]|nr:lycopene cyclase domain-containing protein [bacterium]
MKQYIYLLLCLVFMLFAWLIVQRVRYRATPRILKVALICYLMMVVFNTYLTSLPIVRYDWNKVLGIKMISWPIEDMAYLVVGLYMAQALYEYWLKQYEKIYQATTALSKKSRSKR